jgi:mannitol operon repressor
MTDEETQAYLQSLDPELKELSEFLVGFNQQDDRAAALVAAAMLDDRMRDILMGFLLQGKESKALLDGFNAPLGTFSARVSACSALALIEPSEASEIDLVRRIRNHLAHSWRPASFDDESVAKLTRQLPWLGPIEEEPSGSSRDRFVIAVSVLLVDLMWRTRLVRREQRENKKWPNKTRNV